MLQNNTKMKHLIIQVNMCRYGISPWYDWETKHKIIIYILTLSVTGNPFDQAASSIVDQLFQNSSVLNRWYIDIQRYIFCTSLLKDKAIMPYITRILQSKKPERTNNKCTDCRNTKQNIKRNHFRTRSRLSCRMEFSYRMIRTILILIYPITFFLHPGQRS